MLTDRARSLTRPMVEPVALAAGRLGLSPNGLTVLGAAAHLGVAALLAVGAFVPGAIALAAAAAVDGLDGALARATGRETRAGAFLDSVLDRVSEILVFGGLLYFYANSADVLTGMLAFAALTGSLMVSYTRARSEGIDCQTKAGFFGRLERMTILVVGLAAGVVAPTLALLAIGAWITAALRIIDVVQRSQRVDG